VNTISAKIKIGNKIVGVGKPTFIIAEAGSNHNKKINQAKKLIDVAAESGVDAIKFQLFKAENLYLRKDSLYHIMKSIELPREWVKELAEYSNKRGLIFLATPFDKEAIDYLYQIGIPAYKWASSETVNLELLRYAASKKKPMIVSTGMCDIADIYEAAETIYSAGNNNIILLHCTTLYPTNPINVNLRMMDTLRNCFHLAVGYSDHTRGIGVALAAVARGACVIEKHFTISRKLKGPDHSYALEPEELKRLVQNIREIEKSLGVGYKKMLPEEKVTARRTSIKAAANISRGSIITKSMITIERPALGIRPRFLEAVIGQKAKKIIRRGECITWDDLID